MADSGLHASNWYDVVEFGHADAYCNAYAIIAMQKMAEVKDFLGKKSEAAAYRDAAHRAAEAFNELFWNEELGHYADWVDVKGIKRHYLYVDHNLLAIAFDIAPKDRAAKILGAIDAGVSKLTAQFNITREDIWALPGNLRPTAVKDMVQAAGGTPRTGFPQYENGGSFFHTVGLEAMARGKVNKGVVDTSISSP